MRVTIDKQLLPQVIDKIAGLKIGEQYQLAGYGQAAEVIEAPSNDLPLETAMDISRAGALVETFEYWVEVPNVNLPDNLPDGVSYRDYLDELGDPQIRTWAELGELAANQAATATLRFWQPANNGKFVVEDIEVIREAGFTVYGKAELPVKINAEYEDTGDPEYVVLETIEYINDNWRYAGYFDMVHAHIRMREIYEAKGVDDNARWAASTNPERKVLVRWNQVGLGKASDLAPGSWSEARTVKELGKVYREFNINMKVALEKRFTDWYQYLNMVLSAAGRLKFAADWDWIFRDEYMHRFLRQYELGVTNALVEFNQTVLSTYLNSDFFGTIPAATYVANLERVLNDKTYPI